MLHRPGSADGPVKRRGPRRFMGVNAFAQARFHRRVAQKQRVRARRNAQTFDLLTKRLPPGYRSDRDIKRSKEKKGDNSAKAKPYRSHRRRFHSTRKRSQQWGIGRGNPSQYQRPLLGQRKIPVIVEQACMPIFPRVVAPSLFDEERIPKLPVTERILAPTEVSQYIGLDRCERYLRFRLHEQSFGREFLKQLDVQGQELAPLLSRTGRDFEKKVWDDLKAKAEKGGWPAWNCQGDASPEMRRRAPDNRELAARLCDLEPNHRMVIYQPRLTATLGNWLFRGDADVILAHKAADGTVTLGIADVKSSARVKVEHRLQVAFYRAMLREILQGAGFARFEIVTGILYRGPADGQAMDDDEAAKLAMDKEAARQRFGLTDVYLEIIEKTEQETFDWEIAELVTNPDSDAARIADADFDDLFYALGAKCDGCLYQQYCCKDSHQRGDLSLIPHLSPGDKKTLRKEGIQSVQELAKLKEWTPDGGLATVPQTAGTVRRLTGTGVGPRLDELILRARRTRVANLPAPLKIPGKGHTSLPFTDETHNPNLITIYIDAQQDYAFGRIYLLGAKIVAHSGGKPVDEKVVVHITDSPPDSAAKEAELFRRWIREIWQTVAQIAVSDAAGLRQAPIHLVFWNGYGETALMDALSRNLPVLKEAAPLYDFVAQRAAFDSPLLTFLDQEIRERRNFPFLCQSLQTVAQYLKFGWDDGPEGEIFRKIFRERLFDALGKNLTIAEDGTPSEEWFYLRSRFSSQIPLEYAYGAWNELGEPTRGEKDAVSAFREVTIGQIIAFEKRRLEAMAFIASTFDGNKDTEKTPFALPELSDFNDRAAHLAQALREFVLVERHSDLGQWKAGRNLPAERRALMGETLIVRYREEDQEPEIVAQNRENQERYALRERYAAEFRAANPGARLTLPKEQRDESKWSCSDMTFRLRVTADETESDLDTLLGMLNTEDGKRFLLFPRWTADSRLPKAEQRPLNPTPKTLLWQSMIVELTRLDIQRDAAGKATSAIAEVQWREAAGSGGGFLFGNKPRPLTPGELYTLDADPNDWYGLFQKNLCDGLCQLEAEGTPDQHPLYYHLSRREAMWETNWPDDASAAQRRFYAGLQAFHAAELLHDFEASKQAYIAEHGGDSILLVQGPPGTGKSYTTAFAILARLQGAMAAQIPLRVFVSCKTHSATDVLIRAVRAAQEQLEKFRESRPDLYDKYFDAALLFVPIFRFDGKDAPPPGVFALNDKNVGGIEETTHFVLAATPGGVRKITHKIVGKALFGGDLCDLLVLDEASQLSLPEAMMASLPLSPEGRIIVVGDPRQMPPINHHAWENEPRRAFQEYESYKSLFETLAALKPPMIQFERSFRLHKTIAKYLRDEIYIHDGINYHSEKTATLSLHSHDDAFVAAVLNPEYPLIVIVHGEQGSQTRNLFEQTLIAPLVQALADKNRHRLKADEGFGVVVPHRAQRVALNQAFPELSIRDADTNRLIAAAVDTVERYQGNERDVMLFSATESDPEYLRATAFLLDLRRLNVALSRAKKKMILVASRSVFSYFSPNEELFQNSLMWKNLLRRACTTPLWEGKQEGVPVRVWGSQEVPLQK